MAIILTHMIFEVNIKSVKHR